LTSFVRFILFAGLYAGAVLVWLGNSRGFEGVRVLSAGILLTGAALPAWLTSLGLRRFVPARPLRPLAHVAVVSIVFALLAVVEFVVLDMPRDDMRFIIPAFAVIVAGAAAVDAFVGFFIERGKRPG